MAQVLGHAAWVCVCQIASQQLKRPSPTPVAKSTRLELFVCNCVLSGVTLSAQAASVILVLGSEELSTGIFDVGTTVGACVR
eukprot:COSAG05_NODE_6283_length_986_cov_1.151071_2_plen_82_part_00